jgi:hypothetical protein
MNAPLIIATVVTAVAALTAATFLLPRHVVVARTARVEASPAQVVAVASSTAGYQRFNPYKDSEPNLKIVPFGPDAGVGAGFRFEGKDTSGSQTVHAVQDNAVEYTIDLGARGRPRQRLEAQSAGTGSVVTWTMHADLGSNPVARVMGLMMDRFMGPTLEAGLKNLNTTLTHS